MKNMKMIFYEKVVKERDDGSPVTMEFRGHWDNNDQMPKATLRFTADSEDAAESILTGLGLVIPGESIFLSQGENPQKRLDAFFSKAERRKTPQLENFKAEIADFTDDMLRERYTKIGDTLDDLLGAGKQDSKPFDFYFECLQELYGRIWDIDVELTKEGWIQEHTPHQSFTSPEEIEKDPEEAVDTESWDPSYDEEE